MRTVSLLLCGALLSVSAACGGGGSGAQAAPPPEFQPDSTFGSGGVVSSQGTGSHTDYKHASVASDGSIAIVASNGSSSNTFGDLVIEKRLPDGSPNTAFGGDGQVQFANGTFDPKDIALNGQDGSVIVLADHGTVGYTLLKLKANGGLDSTFGVGGGVEVTTMSFAKLAGLLVDTNGSIVVAGWTSGTSFVMRYLANGNPDPAWNAGVPYTFKIFGSESYIKALSRTSGGSYLVAGNTFEPGDDNKLFVGKISANGQPDSGFGSAGFLIYTPPFSTDVRGIVQRPAGLSFVFGTRHQDTAFALALTATGGILAPFGFRELPSPQVPFAKGSTQASTDGSLTLGYQDQNLNFLLWRLLTNGDPDPGFGAKGVSYVSVPGGFILNRIEPHPLGGFLALGRQTLQPGSAGAMLRLVVP